MPYLGLTLSLFASLCRASRAAITRYYHSVQAPGPGLGVGASELMPRGADILHTCGRRDQTQRQGGKASQSQEARAHATPSLHHFHQHQQPHPARRRGHTHPSRTDAGTGSALRPVVSPDGASRLGWQPGGPWRDRNAPGEKSIKDEKGQSL